VDAVVEGNRYVSALAGFLPGRGGCLRGWARCLPRASRSCPVLCQRGEWAAVKPAPEQSAAPRAPGYARELPLMNSA